MRFMIQVRATTTTEAGEMPDDDTLMRRMDAYHADLVKAGVLLDGSGLKPSSAGWRIRYRAGQRSVIDGPFAETKELLAGYTLIQVRSREEAMEWARRFPAPFGEHAEGEIEVRQLFGLDDFEPSPSMDRFRKLEGTNH